MSRRERAPGVGPQPAVDPLAPVRAALLRAARADAAAALARADRDAQAVLDAAAARADAIREDARAEGRAEAAALVATAVARARRDAREAELAVQREVFDALRARVADVLRQRCSGPDGERVALWLRAAVRDELGPEAVLADADGGGITGRTPGRFVDASFASLAERAVEARGDRVEHLWAP